MERAFCLSHSATIGGAHIVKVLTPQDYRDSAFSASYWARAETMQDAKAQCLAWAKRRAMVQCTCEEIEALAAMSKTWAGDPSTQDYSSTVPAFPFGGSASGGLTQCDMHDDESY